MIHFNAYFLFLINISELKKNEPSRIIRSYWTTQQANRYLYFLQFFKLLQEWHRNLSLYPFSYYPRLLLQKSHITLFLPSKIIALPHLILPKASFTEIIYQTFIRVIAKYCFTSSHITQGFFYRGDLSNFHSCHRKVSIYPVFSYPRLLLQR